MMLAAAATAPAEDGRFEISQSSIPLVITNSGSYVLTANITGAAGTNGITVLADDVSIDLNGFSLIGVAGSLDGISVPTNTYRSNIEVINGTVRAWGDDGVDLFTTSNSILSDLNISSNANAGAKAGFNSVVQRCRAFRNGGIPGPAPSSTNLLGQGIDVENGSIIRQCIIWQNNSHGISAHSGSVVQDTIMWGNGHDGFHGSHATTVRGCVAGGNSEGVEVDSGSQILNSVSGNNSEDGLRCKSDVVVSNVAIAGGITIQGSLAFRNGDNGADLAGPGSQLVNSLIYSNTGHGVRTSDGSLVLQNLVAYNGVIGQNDDGIHVYGNGGRVEGNHVVWNYDRAIQLENGGTGGSGNFIARNTLQGNDSSTPLSFSAGFTNHGYSVTITSGGSMPAADPWANFFTLP